MGSIAPRLLEFTALWTQTPSGYDFLVATSMGSEWVGEHLPVISRGTCHTLYTKHSPLVVDGKLLVCPIGCSHPLKDKAHSKYVRVECQGCKARCSVERKKVARDPGTLLGRRGIMKVDYPPEPNGQVKWASKEEWEEAAAKSLPPAPRPSKNSPMPQTPGLAHSRSAPTLIATDVQPPRTLNTVRPQKRQSVQDFLESINKKRK